MEVPPETRRRQKPRVLPSLEMPRIETLESGLRVRVFLFSCFARGRTCLSVCPSVFSNKAALLIATNDGTPGPSFHAESIRPLGIRTPPEASGELVARKRVPPRLWNPLFFSFLWRFLLATFMPGRDVVMSPTRPDGSNPPPTHQYLQSLADRKE